MSNEHNNQTREIKNLIKFIFEREHDNEAEAREFLSDIGKDPDRIAEEGGKLVEKLIGKARMQIDARGHQKAHESLTQIKQTLAERIREKKTNAKELISQLLSGSNQATFQANFRNLDSLSDEDALDILDEQQLLEAYSKLREQTR